jgi:predicted phosphodiesterase
MRYAIFSDVHSNREALEAVIAAYKDESIDKYLCLGDLVGYAADPNLCVQTVKAISEVTIAGNHDWASVNLFSSDYFNPLARDALEWTKRTLKNRQKTYLESLKLVYKNQDLTLVHGTLDQPSDFNYMTDGYSARKTFSLLETNICFIGHTHVAGMFIKDKKNRIIYRQDYTIDIKEDTAYIINTGSVGQPRDADPRAAYCIYDTEKKEVCLKRIDYDKISARKKIIQAGLPLFLGDRLISAR